MEWRETPIASTREAMSLWAVAPERCNSCVKELALIDTREARCRPPRRGGWLRGRMVSATEAGFNLREMIPLSRNILHSREISALADTGQRPAQWGTEAGFHQVPAQRMKQVNLGDTLLPGRDTAERGKGCPITATYTTSQSPSM
jgi:hypothetical protein